MENFSHFLVTPIGPHSNRLFLCIPKVFPHSAHTSTLKMEAEISSEILVPTTFKKTASFIFRIVNTSAPAMIYQGSTHS
jgi:hypothetical protein